jgi:hypothetical protein
MADGRQTQSLVLIVEKPHGAANVAGFEFAIRVPPFFTKSVFETGIAQGSSPGEGKPRSEDAMTKAGTPAPELAVALLWRVHIRDRFLLTFLRLLREPLILLGSGIRLLFRWNVLLKRWLVRFGRCLFHQFGHSGPHKWEMTRPGGRQSVV